MKEDYSMKRKSDWVEVDMPDFTLTSDVRVRAFVDTLDDTITVSNIWLRVMGHEIDLLPLFAESELGEVVDYIAEEWSEEFCCD